MINLAFLLDITGSMESELSGVKRTVSELVKTVSENDAYAAMVTIITFTEDSKGCYVTNHSFQDGAEASAFVSSVRLCVPPGSSGVHANGGDGDENHKAALAELLRLDGTMPTIAFLISDAGPHLVADRLTPEASQEVAYLKRTHNVVDTDMFHILALVQAHFDGNLILNVLKYTKNSDHRLYGAIAKQFGGVLITPTERRAEKLAAGLMVILTRMFESFSGGAAGAGAATADSDRDRASVSALQGFQFYDIQSFAAVSCEADVLNNSLPVVGSTQQALFELIERATVIVGSKFGKRAIEAAGLQEQVELLLVIAKCLTKTMAFNTALDRATRLLETVRELVPEENQGHIKIQASDLPRLLSQDLTSATSALETTVSAITLMGPEETAKTSLGGDGDADEAAAFDPKALIQTAGNLFLSHLAVLELPEKNGAVDFMDAWSAVIHKVSNDVMSASDFLAMIGRDEATAGLSIRSNEYNYAQMFADPDDKVGSALLQVASGTQVLDIITALLAGAPAGQFSPNMFRGTLAATLMALVSQHDPPLSAYQWAIAHKLVHTMRLVLGPKPQAMKVDPEAPVAKLLFQLVRFQDAQAQTHVPSSQSRSSFAAPRRFLQEMLAARIQKVLKYNPSRFLDVVEHMVGYDNHVSVVEDVFDPHALDADEWKFNVARATERISASKLSRAFQACAANALEALYGGNNSGDGDSDADSEVKRAAVPTLGDVWPTFAADLPKYVLLHKRTARYEATKYCDGATDKQLLVWERNDVLKKPLTDQAFAVLAMQLLRKKHDAFIRELRARRQDAEAEKRWYLALQTMKAPLDEFIRKVSAMQSSACLAHKLLLRAFKTVGSQTLAPSEYEAKLQVLITGRLVVGESEQVVFNRGNLHPHPDRFVPMSEDFKAKLRTLQQVRGWSLSHTYRPSDVPNHSGFSNSNPSVWALRRSVAAQTFWEA